MIINFDAFSGITNWLSLISGILPIVMYSEIHYKFRWFRGFLYKNNPEILFDMPTRIVKKKLPVLLMVKDSNKFPIYLEKAEIQIFKNNKSIKREEFHIKKSISQLFFSQIFFVDVSNYLDQELRVKCNLYTKDVNKTIKIENHNLSRKFRNDFSVYVDSEKITPSESWISGDLHVHSNYTEDQVEFGAELSTYIEMGKSRGLDFVNVMDHSYDFDDVPGTWTFKDLNFTKWENFKNEVKKLNSNEKEFTILPGYELSVDNGYGENVHLGVVNNDEIYSGSGDAMENLKSYASENYFNNILDKLNEKAIAFATHPNAPQSFLHRKILKRGQWSDKNYVKKLNGFQILNGIKNEEFYSGMNMWIEKIVTGKKQNIFAGSDAHGNFNKNLGIKFPLLSLEENNEHVFGEFFSFVNVDGEKSVENIVQSLKNGKVVISDGPFLNLEIVNENQLYQIGDEINFLPEKVNISAKSNKYFGKILIIKLIVGNCCNKREQSLELHDINKYQYQRELGVILKEDDCYIRTELVTENDKMAITNPIWVKCCK